MNLLLFCAKPEWRLGLKIVEKIEKERKKPKLEWRLGLKIVEKIEKERKKPKLEWRLGRFLCTPKGFGEQYHKCNYF